MSGERRNDDSPTGWSRWDPELGEDRIIAPPRGASPAPTEDATYDRTYGTAGQVSEHVKVEQPEQPERPMVRLGDYWIPLDWTTT